MDELFENLIDQEYFTEEELTLLTAINGYTQNTLNDAIYARYGYRNWDQLQEERGN